MQQTLILTALFNDTYTLIAYLFLYSCQTIVKDLLAVIVYEDVHTFHMSTVYLYISEISKNNQDYYLFLSYGWLVGWCFMAYQPL